MACSDANPSATSPDRHMAARDARLLPGGAASTRCSAKLRSTGSRTHRRAASTPSRALACGGGRPPDSAGPGRRRAAAVRARDGCTRGTSMPGAAERAPPAAEPPYGGAGAAQDAASLDELRAILAGFEGCALNRPPSQLVFADGNPQARADVRRRGAGPRRGIAGLPFVGRSGQLLDRMLAAIGLDRTQRLHRQHRALAAARQPHADAAGNRDLPALHRSARSSLPTPTSWSASAARRRRRCSASRTASPRRAGAGSLPHRHARDPRDRDLHPAFLLRSPLQKRLAWRDFLAIKKALTVAGS